MVKAHQQEGALGCPVPGAAGAVLLPSQNQQRDSRLLVSVRGVKHVQLWLDTQGETHGETFQVNSRAEMCGGREGLTVSPVGR